MSISFRCEQCAKPFNVADEFAGKKARCKDCGHAMRIPYGSEIGPAPNASAKVNAYADEEDDGNPYRMVEQPPKPLANTNPSYLDDEEAGPLPPRGPAPATSNAAKFLGPSESTTGARSSGTIFGGSRKGLGIAVTVGLIILRIYFRMNRHQAPVDKPAPAFEGQEIAAAAPFFMPAFPDRADGTVVEPGVTFQAISMGPQKPGPGIPPAHGMTLWLYLPIEPNDTIPAKSLPCVMIAPAGSILVTGNELTSDGGGDHPEHLPWVRAGFAVLAYGLDGELQDGGDEKAEIRKAASSFLAAKAGLTNAHVALEWLLSKVPEVDPNRIYTVGHSSAATMGLLLAVNEPRIKAVAAFAPAADVAARFGFLQKSRLRSAFSGMDQFFTTYNPALHTDRLNCPIFLFSARDDQNVTIDVNEAFAAKLKSEGKNLTFETVPTGGHYQAMINEGIPSAIQWLRAIDQGRK